MIKYYQYQIGSVVWAKFKGYPWWPSRVEDESNIPNEYLENKPKKSMNIIPVYVFGKKKFAWASINYIRPFETYKDILMSDKRTELFNLAVSQAMMIISGISNIDIKKEENENDENLLSVNESSSYSEISEKKIFKQESAGKTNAEKQLIHVVLKIRIKLQKLLKKELNPSTMEHIHLLLNQAESYKLTTNVLKTTKVGKVVKLFSRKTFKEDTYNIKKRCTDLLIKWKKSMINSSGSGSGSGGEKNSHSNYTHYNSSNNHHSNDFSFNSSLLPSTPSTPPNLLNSNYSSSSLSSSPPQQASQSIGGQQQQQQQFPPLPIQPPPPLPSEFPSNMKSLHRRHHHHSTKINLHL